jgi:formate/nitrite transporter FocA (FNT family)
VLLVGNLVGVLVFAFLLARTALVPRALDEPVRWLAEVATEGSFGVTFYRGIFAGWLIALMAWLLSSTAAQGAQIVIIWLCSAAISALGFRHSIASSVEAFYLAFSGAATWGDMIGRFVVPALLGNALGGVVLVALLNYAQVRAERPNKPA